MSDQRYYDLVAEELQQRSLRPGLWTRAVAETGGEDGAARALYIRLRVTELIEIERTERFERENAAAEAQHRAKEEARKERERLEADLRRRTEADLHARAEEELREWEDQKIREAEEFEAGRAGHHVAGILFVGGVLLLFAFLLIGYYRRWY